MDLKPLDFDPFGDDDAPADAKLRALDFDPFSDDAAPSSKDLSERVRAYEEENPLLTRTGQRLEAGALNTGAALSAGMASSEATSKQAMQPFLDRIDKGEKLNSVLPTLPNGQVDPSLNLSATDIDFLRRYSGTPDERKAMREEVDKALANQVGDAVDFSQSSANIPRNPAVAEFGRAMNEKRYEDAAKIMASNPVGIVAQVGTESLPAMLPAMAAGIVNPALGAAVMGGSSAAQEYGSSLLDYLGQKGIDTSSPEAIQKALSDSNMLAGAQRYAAARATIVGAADAASGGIAGKTLVPKMAAREAVNELVAQPIAQSIMGAGGEAAAQLATTGKVSNPGDVALEAVGEAFGAPFEAATFGAERIRGERAKAAEAPPPLSDDDRASPIPDDLISKGKTIIADAEASNRANSVLDRHGVPKVNSRVSVSLPDGRATAGTVVDAADGQEGKKGSATAPGPEWRPVMGADGKQDGWIHPGTGEDIGMAEVVGNAAIAHVRLDNGRVIDIPLDRVNTKGGISINPLLELAGPEKKSGQAALPAPERSGATVTHGDGFTMPGAAQEQRALPSPESTLQPGMKLADGFTYQDPATRNPTTGARTSKGQPFRPTESARPEPTGQDGLTAEGRRQIWDDLRQDPEIMAAAGKPDGDGTRHAPITVAAPEHADTASEVAAAPTEAQKEAGNYQKGHVKVAGLDVTIETPKGATRSGTAPDGSKWSVDMPAHYGYVKRTIGADGDQVDVYIGPDPTSPSVYVVDQIDPATGQFDEHKAMLGYRSEAEAVAAYDAGFSDGSGPKRRGGLSVMNTVSFKKYLKSGDTTKPITFVPSAKAAAAATTPTETKAEIANAELRNVQPVRRSSPPSKGKAAPSETGAAPAAKVDGGEGGVRAEASAEPVPQRALKEKIAAKTAEKAPAKKSRLRPIEQPEDVAAEPEAKPESAPAPAKAAPAAAKEVTAAAPATTKAEPPKKRVKEKSVAQQQLADATELMQGRRLDALSPKERDDLSQLVNTRDAKLQAKLDEIGYKAGPGKFSRKAPVASLDGTEIGKSLPDLRAMRDAATRWFKDHLMGTTATMRDGRVVRFTRTGLRKSTWGKGDVLSRAVPAIKSIIENGHVASTLEGDARHPDVKKNIIIVAPVEIDGETYSLAVTVHETADGLFQYNFTMDNGERDSSGDAGRRQSRGRTAEAERFLREGTPDGPDLNLALWDPTGKEQYDARAQSLGQALSDRLRDLGLSDKVSLRIVERISDYVLGKTSEADGRYFNRMIRVSLGAEDAMSVLNHEAIHALRDMGLINDLEWRALENAAKADESRMADIRSRYPDLSESEQAEEAIADMFADWAKDRDVGTGMARGFIRSAFDHVAGFLKALGSLLRGNGFTTPESIFKAIDAGTIGNRPRDESGRFTNDPKYMVAWHGSPHDFEQFSTRAMGKGEGNQSFGWGMYFAGNKAIAEYYRGTLAGSHIQAPGLFGKRNFDPMQELDSPQAAVYLKDEDYNIPATIERLQAKAAEMEGMRSMADRRQDILSDIAALQKIEKKGGLTKPGKLYQVDLAPRDDQYLDLDKKLSEQSASVRDAIAGLPGGAVSGKTGTLAAGLSGDMTGENFYFNLAKRLGGDKKASLALYDAGVRGNRFLDAGSRGRGSGTSNYVIFSDEDVRVEAKYARPRQATPSLNIAGVQNGLTPAEQALIEKHLAPKSGGLISTLAKNELVREIARDGVSATLIRNLVNQLNPIFEYEARSNAGAIKDARVSAAKMAEFTMNDTGRIWAMMHVGPMRYNAEEGIVESADGGKGLFDIFKFLSDPATYDRFRLYAAARRGQRLMAEGRENNLTPAAIAQGMSYERQMGKNGKDSRSFKDIFDDYQRFNAALLEGMGRDTGMLSQEQIDLYTEHMDYIPFYRQIDDEGTVPSVAWMKKNINKPDAKIKKLEGGDAAIADLMDNIVKNAMAITRAGMRNITMRRIYDIAETLGEGQIVREGSAEDGVLTYKVNGRDVHFRVDDPSLIAAVGAMRPEQMNGLYKAAVSITSFFRNGIVSAPAFMLRNLVRGAQAGFVQTGKNMSLQHNTITGLKRAWRNDKSVRELKAISGTGAYTFGGAAGNIGTQMRRKTGAERQAMPAAVVRSLWHAFERVGEATELADRDAIYNNMMKKGSTKAEAAYQAMNLINYSRKGSARWLRAMLPLIPFLNARIQGLYRMGETQKTGADRRKVLLGVAVRGLLLTATSIALREAFKDDDRYDDEPLHRKLNYYIVYAGDTRILIPKAFEFGALFSTLPELAMDAIEKGETKRLSDGVGQTMLNTFSMNPIPQVALPWIENIANYSFFTGRPLEGQRLENLRPGDRANSGTSEVIKALGSAANVSPVKIENVINGYTGSMGMSLLAGMDAIGRAMGAFPDRPEGPFGGIPLISSALEDQLGSMVKPGADSSNRWVGDFYEMAREVEQTHRYLESLREAGDVDEARQLADDNEDELSHRKFIAKQGRALGKINGKIRDIEASTEMSALEKRQALNDLYATRNRIAEAAVKKVSNRD